LYPRPHASRVIKFSRPARHAGSRHPFIRRKLACFPVGRGAQCIPPDTIERPPRKPKPSCPPPRLMSRSRPRWAGRLTAQTVLCESARAPSLPALERRSAPVISPPMFVYEPRLVQKESPPAPNLRPSSRLPPRLPDFTALPRRRSELSRTMTVLCAGSRLGR
jgi:hypothetical protein